MKHHQLGQKAEEAVSCCCCWWLTPAGWGHQVPLSGGPAASVALWRAETQGQALNSHPTAHPYHSHDVNPRDIPPPQALIRTPRGCTTPRGWGAGGARCSTASQCERQWHRDVTMVPARAAAASVGHTMAGAHCGGGGVCICTGVLPAACESLFVFFPLSGQFIPSG